ncbi:hypothetical protein L596_019088 [Steinernema carpocapsae]|uniref:Uncharacterized protein n=1 Tax=Steinernema carpocapsae TaxID=34508 RepID=A0A4U5N8H1_STECR|nr:hypothetical protein L596_019088 [Steinernema carpocapsae]
MRPHCAVVLLFTLTSLSLITNLSASTGNAAKPEAAQKRSLFSKLKWIAPAALAVGGVGYVLYALSPDRRELNDRKHYYSDWKIRLYFSLP